jgi:hypothetical protein
MKAKIDSEQGKNIYARRLGIVEPVFANICVHKCFLQAKVSPLY